MLIFYMLFLGYILCSFFKRRILVIVDNVKNIENE